MRGEWPGTRALLAHVRGWRVSASALTLGMVALIIWLLVSPRRGLGEPGWEIQALFVVAYVVFWLVIGVVTERHYRHGAGAGEEAVRDPLTGLWNRRSVEMSLDAELTATKAKDGDLSIVLVEIDQFMRLIDTHGHAAGDQVVLALARLLRERAGRHARCGRIGHDAFVAILPGTDHEEAMRFAETVRQEAAALDVPWRPLSLSAGVATLARSMARGDQLLEAAARSLARAKELGGDRVEVDAGQASVARALSPHTPRPTVGGPLGFVALPADSRQSVRRVLELSGLRVAEFDDPREVRFPVEADDGPAILVTAIPKLAGLEDLLWSLDAGPADSTSVVVFVGDATETGRLPEREGVMLLRGLPSGEGLLPLMGGLLAGAHSAHAGGIRPDVGGFESSLVSTETPLTDARILVVDDEDATRQALHRTLQAIGFKDIVPVAGGEEALSAVVEHPPDLIILDLQMPGMDGFAVLRALRPLLQGDGFLPVLVVTGDQEREHRQQVLSSGAKDFLRKPFDVSELGARVLNLLETRRLHLRLREANVSLDRMVRHRNQELGLAKDEIIFRLARTAEYRDDSTGRHAARVAAASAVLAAALGLDPARCELIRRAAPLHDVGKIAIADAILLKPGRLTADEMDIMKSHTTIGADLLAHSTSDVIEEARVIAMNHHERWDGAGYPAGLRGDAIPIEGRVVALADALDALTHARPYKPAHPFDESMRRLITDSGSAFDAEVVAALQTAAFRVRDILLEPDEVGAQPTQ